MFIVFEGIDGSGKTSQISKLFSYLLNKGIKVITTKEPSDSFFGHIFTKSARLGNRLPLEKEIELLLNDRKEHIETFIKPYLKKGYVVISDRYYPSMMAYQGSDLYTPETIYNLNKKFAIDPDIAFLLDIPVKDALSRIAKRNTITDNFENEEFLNKCSAIYSSMTFPWMKRIDATKPAEEIHKEIAKHLIDKLNAYE